MAGYAPRSPDLSGSSYIPRSPDLSGQAYVPRSPDLGPDHHAGSIQDVPAQPLGFQSYAQAQVYHPQQQHLNVPGAPAFQPQDPLSTPAKPRARKASSTEDPSYSPQTQPKAPGPGRGRRKKQKVEEEVEDENQKPAPGTLEGIEVKTKFPVARIKRIMQHDEEVGKVSQVTPTAVSKALELFMISIVLKSAQQARDKSSKKVTVSHMKQVVAAEPEFDFLLAVCEKYADAPAPKGKKKKAKDKDEEEDHDD